MNGGMRVENGRAPPGSDLPQLMRQVPVTKPSNTVEGWLTYLAGNPGDQPKQKTRDSEQSDDDTVTQKKSRVRSASNRKFSFEAKIALSNMGLETDDGESRLVSPEPNLRPGRSMTEDINQLPLHHSFEPAALPTIAVPTPVKTPDNSPRKSIDLEIAHGSTGHVDKKICDTDRIMTPLDKSYRSELKKITGRMGIELDAMNAVTCSHINSKKQNVSTSANKLSNLPSCSRCRQQFFQSHIQSNPRVSDSFPSKPQIARAPAFNTSAPRRSYLNVNPQTSRENTNCTSPQSSLRKSMHNQTNKSRSKSANVTNRLRYPQSNDHQLSSRQNVTQLADNPSPAKVPTRLQSARAKAENNRIVVINSGLKSTVKSTNQLVINGNTPTTAAEAPGSPSRRYVKTSMKLQEIEKLDSNGVVTSHYDRRYESTWARPWETDSGSSDRRADEEISEESRQQSIAKCKEWFALWFSAQTSHQ